MKKGRKACPNASVSTSAIKAFVMDRIRGTGKDPQLVDSVMADLMKLRDERGK